VTAAIARIISFFILFSYRCGKCSVTPLVF
jgi:hypothetical protein